MNSLLGVLKARVKGKMNVQMNAEPKSTCYVLMTLTLKERFAMDSDQKLRAEKYTPASARKIRQTLAKPVPQASGLLLKH